MNALAQRLRDEMLRDGPITFRRFMARALYEPEIGYYERAIIGQAGDFQTNVSVSPLFGELLAGKFGMWLEAMDFSGGTEPTIVEAGAHDGRAGADILRALHNLRPSLAEKVRYVILEPSMIHRHWQQAALTKWREQVVWIKDWKELGTKMTGIIFSNELLDALPFRRMAWSRSERRWRETGVTWENGQFAWQRLPENSVEFVPDLSGELLELLPDGFMTEHCPDAENWWGEAAGALAAGVLATFDYGLDEPEFFAPHRAQGTARGYYRHRLVSDLLHNPGEQDLTAQVNFTRVKRAGEAAGLLTVVEESQARFLTRVLLELQSAGFFSEAWIKERSGAFQTLTHPDHFGRSFRVLAQEKTAA